MRSYLVCELCAILCRRPVGVVIVALTTDCVVVTGVIECGKIQQPTHVMPLSILARMYMCPRFQFLVFDLPEYRHTSLEIIVETGVRFQLTSRKLQDSSK